MNRSKLQVSVLILALLTHAIQTSPIDTTIKDMKNRTQELLDFLKKEAEHALTVHNGTHIVGCISEPDTGTNDLLSCKQISTFDAYFAEAIALNIQSNLTDGLKTISQHIVDYRKRCNSETPVTSCMKAFQNEDKDYQQLFKVRSLLVLFTKWLERPVIPDFQINVLRTRR